MEPKKSYKRFLLVAREFLKRKYLVYSGVNWKRKERKLIQKYPYEKQSTPFIIMSGSSFNRGPAYGFSAEVKSKVSVHGVELSANESLALLY